MQKKKVWVLELILMDLFDKAEEIAMTNISILYNTNPMPFAICVSPPFANLKQQGSSVKARCKLQKFTFCDLMDFLQNVFYSNATNALKNYQFEKKNHQFEKKNHGFRLLI